MSIRTEILENFESLSSEKEMRAYLNEIITALHEINCSSLSSLLKEGALSDDRANSKQEQTDVLLKQIAENILENIRIMNLTKKAKAYEVLKKENENLSSKIEKAKEIISEKEAEIEKAKKATRNDIKRKLQIGRDKIVAIANTSTALGECVDDAASIDILNNIRDNVGLLTEEMVALGLWGEEEEKPNVEPLVAKVKVISVEQHIVTDAAPTVSETIDEIVEKTPKKKSTKKSLKKSPAEHKADVAVDTLDDFDSFEDNVADKQNVNETSEVQPTINEDTQISVFDVAEGKKQEN
jgi:hypothetical protein